MNDKIKEINEYLKSQLWMDFEVVRINGGNIELYGYLDEAGENKIKIVFESPYMLITSLNFTYEGEKDFIALVTGSEALKINKRFNVIVGNSIFRLANTNIETDMYVVAKGIDFCIFE